ncbi:MAG: L-ribulose-5-phosphate 4-epimerase [Lachnospiraceae bacterium]|nr:L-ribulose-5-phosphate 4-epimerase [Lachnospiraceae bacterium]
MLESLKNEVCEANLLLPKNNLITLTWGNVSGIDREKGLVVIKPSGVSYSEMKPEDMVVLDLDGNIVEGNLRPSSDTPTHLALYREFPELGGVTHTHSRWATTMAQSGLDIPALGTTHADYFYGPVPCARCLSPEEIDEDYEGNTGKLIIETFKTRGIKPMDVPAVLLKSHGPFTWGKNPYKSVENAIVLEEVAFMAWHNLSLSNCTINPVPQSLLDKHYFRKHGANAYYGQSK